MKKRLIVLCIAAILVLTSFAGCSKSGGPVGPKTPTDGKEKVLTILYDDPPTLDPQAANNVVSARYILEIYSGLLTIVEVPETKQAEYMEVRHGIPVLKPGLEKKFSKLWEQWEEAGLLKGELVDLLAPDLAEFIPDPEFNDDGTVSYTFKIRENAYFHNGKKVTAHDFKFSFERAADPRGPDQRSKFTLPTCDLYLSDIVGVRDKMRGRVKEVEGVEVIDDQTLRITIDSPKVYFLWNLSYPTAFVIDKDLIVDARTGKPFEVDWTENPNGTGPFKLREKNFEEIVLVRNENYYLELAKIDKIVFNLEGGDSMVLYEKGEIDITGIGIDYLYKIDPKDPRYQPELAKQHMEQKSLDTWYIGFNCVAPPFDDVKVRQAFAMAIDKDKIVEVILKNQVLPARGILPPGIPGYQEDFEGLPFDPEKAKELLHESKYWTPAGLDWDPKEKGPDRMVLYRSSIVTTRGDVTVVILDMWKQNLGVEVETDQHTFTTFQTNLALGKFQMFTMGWVADYPDPQDFLDLKFHSERFVENRDTRYSNPEVDELLGEARVEQNHEKRMELYQKAHEIIVREAPWIPLFHSFHSILIKPYLKGYVPGSMVLPIFRLVDIKK